MTLFFKRTQRRNEHGEIPMKEQVKFTISKLTRNVVTDCAVVNIFNCGSNHILVRYKEKFQVTLERQKLIII